MDPKSGLFSDSRIEEPHEAKMSGFNIQQPQQHSSNSKHSAHCDEACMVEEEKNQIGYLLHLPTKMKAKYSKIEAAHTTSYFSECFALDSDSQPVILRVLDINQLKTDRDHAETIFIQDLIRLSQHAPSDILIESIEVENGCLAFARRTRVGLQPTPVRTPEEISKIIKDIERDIEHMKNDLGIEAIKFKLHDIWNSDNKFFLNSWNLSKDSARDSLGHAVLDLLEVSYQGENLKNGIEALSCTEEFKQDLAALAEKRKVESEEQEANPPVLKRINSDDFVVDCSFLPD